MSRKLSRRALPFLVILGLIAGLMALSGLAVAKPGKGNSANAMLCASWQTLFRADGSTFANRDECVSYGAMGGVILTEPPVPPLPNLVTINPGSAFSFSFEASGAEFGPVLDAEGVMGSFIESFDFYGCAPYAGFPAGGIAITHRGGPCSMVDKVLWAESSGAIGVVIINDMNGPPTTIDGTSEFVDIPAVMVSLNDGFEMISLHPGTVALQAKP